MDIYIKQVNTSDVNQLQIISHRTFSETFSKQNDVSNMETYLNQQFGQERLISELSNPASIFYFAILNDEIIGYLKVNLLKDKLEIQRIYVLSKFKGQGIGSLLMKQAEHVANENHLLTLSLGVWENNDQAIKFYVSKGFKQTGEQPFNLGGDIQTDYILTKSLH